MEDYREIGPPGNGKTRKTGASNLAAVRETTRHVRIHASRVIFRGALKCKFSFIGSFFDPPKAKEAAIAQIEAGVDVIYAERFGVVEAAKERGIAAIGNMSDQTGLGPDTVVTSVVWDMWPTVKQVVSLVKAGVFTSQDFGQFSYMGKGGSFLAPYHGWDKKLPDDIKKMVADRRQEILDSTFRVGIDESAPRSD